MNCRFPTGLKADRIGNFNLISENSETLLLSKNNDPTDNDRYTRGGRMARDNTIRRSGASSARIECWYAGTPHTYSFPVSVAPNQSVQLVGYLRFNSTYGTATPPTVTVSGLGITPTVFTTPAVADTWHRFDLTVTNPNNFAGEFTVTVAGQSAANSEAASVWFDGVPVTPWIEGVRHFGFQFDGLPYRTLDARITLTEAQALALPVAVNHVAQTITVTGQVTPSEVMQACLADLCQTSNLSRAIHITSADGSTFTTTYTVVGGDFITGPYTDATGTRVRVTAPALISGSRVQLYNVTTQTELFNGVLSGAGLNFGVTFTAAHTIRLRAEHSTKLPLEVAGVLSQTGLTFLDTQLDDTVYINAGIDGSTVTEFSADGPNIQVDINDPDGLTSVQRLYAWMQHYQTTAVGIASSFFGAMSATDDVNFVVDQARVDLKLDNVSAIPLRVVGGHLSRKDGSSIIAPSSFSIQMEPGKAYAVQTAVSGLTPTESAQLSQAAQNAALAAALSA